MEQEGVAEEGKPRRSRTEMFHVYVTTACIKKIVGSLKSVLNATLYFIVANVTKRNSGVNKKSCVTMRES